MTNERLQGPAGGELSAVVVPVPEAEPVVAEHRARFDRAAGWGVGAHVSVLFPFMPLDRFGEEVLDRLAAAVQSVPAFATRFESTAWFAEDVVYLEPLSGGPFRALTRAVCAAFPGLPPYGGAHGEDVVPHLTVGHAPLATPEDLRAAEAAVAPRLPVVASVTHAVLLAGRAEPSSWRPVVSLPLA